MSNQQPDSKWETPNTETTAAPWYKTYQKELGLFALLLLVLTIIAVWLPQKLAPAAPSEIHPDAPAAVDTQGAAVDTQSTSTPVSTPLESPWQDAQTAKARREAQEILAKLMDRQTRLESMSVLLWAEEAYNTARDDAAKADELYRQRQFLQAQELYQEALDAFDVLVDESAGQFQQALTQGAEALQTHTPDVALSAFELASAIDTNSEEARRGLERATTLPQVMALLSESDNLSRTQQLSDALQKVNEALQIDAEDPVAQQQQQALQEAITDRDFKLAMGRAYIAVQNKQPAEARKQFLIAKKLKPESDAPGVGLNQLNNEQQSRALERLFKNAQAAETKERWQTAADYYGKALLHDQSLIQAKVGQLRSSARAKLDNRLQSQLSQPLRLSSNAVYGEAQSLLQDARAIKQPGPVLNQQIRELDEMLRLARLPVAVTLRSDNATEVTVYKVGALGQFSEQHMELIPGRYVAVGSRQGYRDVRKEFTISPSGTRTSVWIQCTEKIALDS